MWSKSFILGILIHCSCSIEYEDEGGIVLQRDVRQSDDDEISGDCVTPCPHIQFNKPGVVTYNPGAGLSDDIVPGTVATFSCKGPFTLTPPNMVTSTCQQDGTWSQPPPSCVSNMCPKIRFLRKGFAKINGKTGGTAKVGEEVKYTCKHNYRLVPDVDTNKCLPGGVWQRDQPVCVKVGAPVSSCPYVPFKNGFPRTRNKERKGSSITFRCTGFSGPGRFAFQSGDREISLTCGDDGKWEGDIPTCLRIDCPNLKIPNGKVRFSPRRRIKGTVASFSCNRGFKLHPAGRTTAVCQYGGRWSEDFPVCIEDDCDTSTVATPAPTKSTVPTPTPTPSKNCVIPTVLYGKVSGSGDAGSVATVTCDPGFQLVGKATVRCLPTGEWEGPFPTCPFAPRLCDEPAAIDNGFFMLTPRRNNPGALQEGSTAHFECRSGFRLEPFSGRKFLDSTCTNVNGELKFVPAAPKCVPNLCNIPTVANGQVSSTGLPGRLATVKCNEGFKLTSVNGEDSVRCIDGTHWDFPFPTCDKVERCPKPAAPLYGFVMFDPRNAHDVRYLAEGSTAFFQCHYGFRLFPLTDQRSIIIKCTNVNGNLKFVPNAPLCVKG